MPDGNYGFGTYDSPTLAPLIAHYIGETVTIFTSSGGQSGSGFTGVVLAVNEYFVRMITKIGPPPGCALGNSCTGFNVGSIYDCGYGYGPNAGPGSQPGSLSAGGWDGIPIQTIGAVTDIPLAAVVSFVHNAI